MKPLKKRYFLTTKKTESYHSVMTEFVISKSSQNVIKSWILSCRTPHWITATKINGSVTSTWTERPIDRRGAAYLWQGIYKQVGLTRPELAADQSRRYSVDTAEKRKQIMINFSSKTGRIVHRSEVIIR